LYLAFVAVSAWFGVVGLVARLLPVSGPLAARLPLHSPMFGGIALACVVAIPATVVTSMASRRHRRTADALTLVGLLLVGWIVVEAGVVREFSPLQPVYLLAGMGLILLGDRGVLGQVADVLAGLPLFLAAPLVRHWHLRWGATPEEVGQAMPGDVWCRSRTSPRPARSRSTRRPRTSGRGWSKRGIAAPASTATTCSITSAVPAADAVLPEWQHPGSGTWPRDGQPADRRDVVPRGPDPGRHVSGVDQAGLQLGLDAGRAAGRPHQAGHRLRRRYRPTPPPR
jgi:hypothetical protein